MINFFSEQEVRQANTSKISETILSVVFPDGFILTLTKEREKIESWLDNVVVPEEIFVGVIRRSPGDYFAFKKIYNDCPNYITVEKYAVGSRIVSFFLGLSVSDIYKSFKVLNQNKVVFYSINCDAFIAKQL